MSNIVIKEVDAIVAIQILADTYKIDVFEWKKSQLEEIIRLLTLAKEYKKLEEEQGEK